MLNITLKELAELIEDMYNYDCRVDGAETIKEFVQKLKEYRKDVLNIKIKG